MRILPLCFLIAVAVWAQDPEQGYIDISSSEAILKVDYARPVDSAAKTLAVKYGIVINSKISNICSPGT
jgi:hypothetical protein